MEVILPSMFSVPVSLSGGSLTTSGNEKGFKKKLYYAGLCCFYTYLLCQSTVLIFKSSK